ncbi:DUF305 domain-containing protein [Leptolyngbya sp. DQ-M1]
MKSLFKPRALDDSPKPATIQLTVGIIARASLPLMLATLAACSTTTTQNSSPASNPMPGMDHSTMNHGSTGNMMHNMDLGAADDNYDLRFIDAMRIHHRGAIEMAKQAEQKSQRSEIKTLARNIVITQNREENELLAKWRNQWYPKAAQELVMYGGKEKSTIPMSVEYRQMMSMQQDLGTADAQFDLRFINAMIPHHEGAIAMAKDALQKSKRPEIKQLAQEIATSQQTEVDQMKQWRKAWYNQ